MSRHSRLIAVLAPSLAFSNVAFALTVNVGGSTVTTPCDSTNPAQTVCDETSVYKAIAAVNDRGDATNVIDIDEATYELTNESSTPVILYPTTIKSDAVDPAALPWRLQTIRAGVGAHLTLQNLAINTGDVGPSGSGEWYSAVDVIGADLTGTNLVLGAGSHPSQPATPSGRPYLVPQAIYLREGNLTLTDATITQAVYPFNGGVYVDDGFDSADAHDIVVADSTFTSFVNGQSRVVGIRGIWVDSVTVSNTTFLSTTGYAISILGNSLDVTDSAFDGADTTLSSKGILFTGGYEGGELRISDSTFTNLWDEAGGTSEAAVRIDGYGGDVHALIEHSTFLDNYSRYGSGDLTWMSPSAGSTLDVVDTAFNDFHGYYGGSVHVRGGTARFVDSSWDGTTPSGGEGYNASAQGGAIYQTEDTDLWVERSTFANTSANSSGGAVYVYGGEGSRSRFVDTTFSETFATTSGGAISAGEGDYSFVRTSFDETVAVDEGGGVELRHPTNGQMHTTFIDSAFTDTRALYGGGGGLSARGPQYVEMSGVSFTRSTTGFLLSEEPAPTTAGSVGYYAYGGEGGGAIRVNGQGDYYRGQLGASYLYGGESGVTLIADHLDVVDAAALFGGVFYAQGAGNTIVVSDSSFTDSVALQGPIGPSGPAGSPAGIGGEYGILGLGGVAYSDPGNRIEFHSSNLSGSTAYLGGALFSGSFDWYHDSVFAGSGPIGCFDLNGYLEYDGPDYGTEWVIDGVAFDDGSAQLGATVAWFGRHDSVAMTGSTITGNSTTGRGTIVSSNASRIDLSCNTFCDNEVGMGASGIEVYDDAMFPEFEAYDYGYGGEQKEVRYELGNNVFQDGVSGAEGYGAVFVQTCPSVVEYYNFATAGGSYGGEGTRGHVKVFNNTFVGNTGVNFGAETTDVRLDVRNNLFQDGEVGWLIGYDANYVEGGYNLYGDTVEDVLDYAGFGFDTLDATNQTDPAVFRSYTPGTCGAELYLEPGSQGIDDADPDPIWNDNWPNDPSLPDVPNIGDIGAFGGPGACVPDADHDTQNAIVDCDDATLTTYVDAIEVPYDGVDQDCDGADLCDIDADGALADYGACGGTDCNDLDPSVRPGATEIIGDDIDQNCDGVGDCADADADGFADVACGGVDCNDTNAAINPGEDDIPDNTIDEDCSGADRACDVDGDGVNAMGCPEGLDCDDTDATIYVGADEVGYDGIDQDCDGDDLIDVDCDGFVADASHFPGGVCPEGVICGDDCDDADPATNPEASDNPLDDIDQDCDGTSTELWAQGGLGCGCATPGTPNPVGSFGVLAAALLFVRRRGQR